MRQFLILICVLMAEGAVAQSLYDAWNVKLLGNWNDAAHIRLNTSGARYNEVSGFVWKGKEYGVIGSTEGAHIIDIDQCTQVFMLPARDSGNTIVHRDYEVYRHYLYTSAYEGNNVLQIWDFSYLPDSIHLAYESDFMLSVNLFIDTAKATLYACSAKSLLYGFDQMQVFSLSNAEKPTLLTRYNRNSEIHDVYVRNDTAYCSSANYGYEVVDFSKQNTTWQNIAEMRFYPFQGYNHSSWLNEKGFGVLSDETHGFPLKVIDVRNLDNLKVVSTFKPNDNDSLSIPHKPLLKNDFAFISYYFDGLQIYDISDPYHPVRTGYFDTYPSPSFLGFAGAWGCYPFLPSGRVLISDMQSGLFVLDVSDAVKRNDTNDYVLQTMQVSPNPFNEALQLSFPKEDIGTIQVTIFDVLGKLIYSKSLELFSNSIQPIHLPLPACWENGVYFIKALTPQHQYQRKISKTK